MRGAVEQIKAVQSTATKAALPQTTPQPPAIEKTVQDAESAKATTPGHKKLEAMQAEVASGEERRRKIHANFEDRARGLQQQLQRAKLDIAKAQAKLDASKTQLEAGESGPMPFAAVTGTVDSRDPDPATRLEKLAQSQEELVQQWLAVSDLATRPEALAGPALHFWDRSSRCNDELRSLQRQFSSQKDAEMDARQQHQSELRELLCQLREQLDDLDGGPTEGDLERLLEQNRRQREELESFRRSEAGKRCIVQELQDEQDSLLGWTSAPGAARSAGAPVRAGATTRGRSPQNARAPVGPPPVASRLAVR